MYKFFYFIALLFWAIQTSLAADVVGSVSLPQGQFANSGQITTEVTICSYTSPFDLSCISESVNISNGESSADFALSYTPVPEDIYYTVTMGCTINCGAYITPKQYLQHDGSTSLNYANIDIVSPSTNVNFTLIEPIVLSGEIKLPSTDVANQDISNNVVVCSYGENFDLIGCVEDVQTITLGSSSANFEVPAIPAPEFGHYNISTQCIENCSPYISSEFFLRSDLTTTGTYPFDLSADLMSQSFDFVLEEGRPISGSISLPNGELALNDIGFRFNYCSQNSYGISVFCTDIDGTIPMGSNSVVFEGAVRFAPNDGQYSLSISCISVCGPYISDQLYLQDDLSSDFTFNSFEPSAFPQTAHMELKAGYVLSGLIQLPNSEIAEHDIYNYLSICSNDSTGSNLSCTSKTIKILAGENSKSYSLTVRTAPSNGSYQVNTRCNGYCGLYVANTRHLQPNLSLDYDPATIAALSMPNTVDLTLVRGHSISGEVKLPTGDLADSDIELGMRFCSYNSAGDNLGCSNVGGSNLLTIENGNQAVAYEIAVRPAPAGGYYELMAQCSFNCGPYLDDELYLQPDLGIGLEKAQIADSSLPSSVDFTLFEGQVVSGSINLPIGETAVGNISSNVTACSYNSDGSNVDCTSRSFGISSSANSGTYSLTLQSAPIGGYYRLFSECSSNCGLYIKNRQHLQADLTLNYSTADVDAAIFPQEVDINLSKGTVVSGVISLPNGELSDRNMGQAVTLCSYSATGEQLSCGYDNGNDFFIAAGSNSIPYEISVLPAPIDGYYQFSSRCSSNCGLYLDTSRYLQDNLTFAFNSTQIPENTLPESFDFQLTTGTVVNGTLSLPTGEIASAPIGSEVSLCSYTDTGSQISCTNDYSAKVIETGENSVAYAVSVVPAPAGGSYRLSTYCSSGCGLYLSDAQYLQSDLSIDFNSSEVATDNLPTNVDFTLNQGRALNGVISLPNSDIAQQDITSNISLCSYENNGDYLGCNNISAVIPAGESSASYELSVLPAPNDGEYRLSTYCWSNCGFYLRDSRYLQPDLSLDFEESPIAASALPEVVDLQLLDGKKISGVISLPNAQLATQGFVSRVSLCAFDENNNYLDCENVQVTINSGDNEAQYALSIRPAPAGGYYSVYSDCNYCGLFLPDTQYLQSDLTTGYEDVTVAANLLPETINFELDKGKVIAVNLRLPDSELASTNINNNVEFCSYDDLGNTIACRSAELTIVNGSNSVSRDVSVRDAPSDGLYRVSTICNYECGLYLSDQQYLQPDLTTNTTASFLPASSLPDETTFTLIKGQVLSVSLALPNGAIATGNVQNYVQFCSVASNGGTIDCTYDYVEIANGTNGTSYEVAIRPAPQDGSYSLYTHCSANCGLYVQDRQHLQADLSIGYEFANVSALVFPSAVSFILPVGVVIDGTVSLPNGQIASRTFANEVSICSSTSDNQQIACGSTEVDILSGQTAGQYAVSVRAAPSGGNYTVSTSCNYSCDPYLTDRQYLQQDLQISFEPASVTTNQLPETINFELSRGTVLAGNFTLPNPQTAASAIRNRIEICAYGAGDQYLGCEYSYSTIEVGQNSAAYEVSVRPAPEDGYYRVSTACYTNCGRYLDVTRYIQPDLTMEYVQADVAALDLPDNYDIELATGREITGNIMLPNSEVAVDAIQNLIRLCSYNSGGTLLDCSSTYLNIEVGSNSTSYLVSTRPAPEDGYYILSTQCQYNCGLYVDTTRYLQSDLSVVFEESQVPTTTMPDEVHIALTKGVLITGNINLPAGDIADDVIVSKIELCSYDENGSYIDCAYADSTIAISQSGANYQVSVSPAPTSGQYQLSTYCYSNCGAYIENRQYLQEDLSTEFEQARVDQDLLPSSMDFTLDTGRILTGNLSLSNAEVASGAIYNSVDLCSYDANQDIIDCSSIGVTITDGANNAPFSLAVIPAPNEGYYQVSTYCLSNCGSYLREQQFLQDDLTTVFAQTRIVATSLPESIDLALNKGTVLSGKVELPDGMLAANNLNIGISICSFNQDGVQQNCTNKSDYIAKGSNSVNYDISIVPAPNLGYYQIFAECRFSCSPYLTSRNYLQSDLSIKPEPDNISISDLPSEADLVLREGVALSGNIKLSGLVPAQNTILLEVELCSYNSVGVQIRCADDFLAISSGQLSESYEIGAIEPAPADGYYRVKMECDYNCDDFIAGPQYLQSDLSTGFGIANVPAATIPDIANFTLYKITPDAFEPDDEVETATSVNRNVVQTHNIHEAGDEDWIELIVSETSTLHFVSESAVDELPTMIELFDYQLNSLAVSEAATLINSNYLTQIQDIELTPGTYYIMVSAESPGVTISSYVFTVDGFSEDEDDELCIPIKAKNGNIALICL